MVKDTASTGEAQAEANTIVADASGPYWNTDHPLHKETVERVTKLLIETI